MKNINLLSEFYVKKNFLELKSFLEKQNDFEAYRYLAKIYLKENDYLKSAYYFEKCKMLYEVGRCYLLAGKLEETRKIWKSIKNDNPATLWGQSLLQFIDLYVVDIPTFFQIRCFLEVDLNDLIQAGQREYAENIMNGANLFARANSESYKFIGRVMVNNNYHEIAMYFLNQAKDICYVDPEVHFLIAKCYLNEQKKSSAIKSLETAIEKGYGYYPAKKLLAAIK